MEEKRYFENPYKDFDSSAPDLITGEFTGLIKGLIHKNVNLILATESHKNLSRSDVYVGLSGIAYMFLKLSQSPIRDEFPALQTAKLFSENSKKALKSSKSRKPISFLSGDAGVHVVSAAVSKSCNEPFNDSLKLLLQAVPVFENPEYLDDGADEMLVGRCGYLLGLLWLNRELETEIVPTTELKRLSSIILDSGRNYARRYKLKVPLMYQFHGREYLGAAHGISAILFSLLSVPMNERELMDVKATIDGILELQDSSGNFPSKFNKSESHLVHWCHGAPGIFYLMAKAHKVFGDKKYLDSCLKCGDLVWQRGLLRKGPGICHGIAGNGYVHLMLFRLTGDSKHLYRAMKFAEFLESEAFHNEARKPDRPLSLYEGIAGTVCYLIDLLQPEKAEFPFMILFN